MIKDKINSFEFASLIPFLSSSAIMGSGFLYLFNKANKSSILSMIIGLIISVLFALIVFKTLDTFPDKTLPQKIKCVFPKWIYYILSTIIGLILLIISALVLYRLTLFFSTQFLTDTPKIALSSILVIIPFYFLFKNIESITRFSNIALLICVFVFLFNFFSLFPQVDINNVLPMINVKTINIIKSSLVFSLLFSGPLIGLLIVPKNNISDKKNIKKWVIINYILTSFILLGINFITLSTMGIENIKLYTYPVYMVLKKIHIFEFINSIENITILIWFFFLIVTSSLYLMFSRNIFVEIFNIKKSKEKYLNIILNIFILMTPILYFSKKTIIDKPKLAIYPVIAFIILFSILLVVITLAKLKKK